MSDQDSELIWTQPEWKAQAQEWIQTQLKRLDIEMTGLIEQPHIRPWSTIMRVPTGNETLFFKASAPAFAAETALTAYVSEQRPDCATRVLAADAGQGWMLMMDGGERLRNLLKGKSDITRWHEALRPYAEMQREVSERLAEILAFGLPDRRLAILPSLYEDLLRHKEDLGIGLPESLTEEEYAWLCRFTPRFARLCEQLTAFGLPETLQHDDLHDGNILVRDGRYHLFDWGDSCIAHPFFTLVVTLRSAAHTLALEDDDPLLRQLRDDYLDVWDGYGSRDELNAALEIALKVGMVCRALTWHRVLSNLSGPLRATYLEYAGGWMQEFYKAMAAG